MLCIFILYISILTHAPPSPPFLTFGARHSHGCGRLYACSPPGGTQCPPFTVLVLVINTYYYYYAGVGEAHTRLADAVVVDMRGPSRMALPVRVPAAELRAFVQGSCSVWGHVF